MDSISITTINIEYGNRNRKNIKERSDIIKQYNPDIIFIQECDKTAVNFEKKYNYIDYTIISNEVVDVYLRKDSDWKQEYIHQFNTKHSYTVRTCKIIYLKNINSGKILKLANVHLCGGRFDENDKIGGMLLGNIKEVRKRKNEILEKLVCEYNIDIIAGDFNSDLVSYINNELQSKHFQYFKKISPNTSIEIFKEWNVAPYKYLESHNYTTPINKSNAINTSIFKTHPDSIWYKNGSINDFKYIDLIKNNLSDHNGIFCNIFF